KSRPQPRTTSGADRGHELQRVPREHPHRAVAGIRRYLPALYPIFQRSAATPPSEALIYGGMAALDSLGNHPQLATAVDPHPLSKGLPARHVGGGPPAREHTGSR